MRSSASIHLSLLSINRRKKNQKKFICFRFIDILFEINTNREKVTNKMDAGDIVCMYSRDLLRTHQCEESYLSGCWTKGNAVYKKLSRVLLRFKLFHI